MSGLGRNHRSFAEIRSKVLSAAFEIDRGIDLPSRCFMIGETGICDQVPSEFIKDLQDSKQLPDEQVIAEATARVVVEVEDGGYLDIALDNARQMLEIDHLTRRSCERD